MQYKSEIAIIGGGIAGLVVAHELLNTGRKIIIYDRDQESNLGGLAKESFGGIFLVDTSHQRRIGIKDNPELAYNDWLSYAEFGPEDTWPRKWAEYYVTHCRDDVYQWLRKEIGIGFFPVVHWVERGMQTPGNSVPRFHMVWGTGHELIIKLIKAIYKHLKRANLEIRYRHRAMDLIFSNGRVSGFSGTDESTGSYFSAEADHVVIAAGGIAGNIPLIKETWYKPWGISPEILLNGSHRYALGDLHEAARKTGAHLTHLDLLWNYAAGIHHPNPKMENHGLSIVPPRSALWVNYRGERIGPLPLVGSFDTRSLVEGICAQEKKYSWQIMNWKIAKKELAVSGSEFNDSIRNKNLLLFIITLKSGNSKLLNALQSRCPDFITAHTVNELAAKMNSLNKTQEVDAAILNRAIQAYDAEVQKGKGVSDDEQLKKIELLKKYRGDRIRIANSQLIHDPKALPLVAIREFILTRKSLGGIQTDLNCRVLKPDGEYVPGLYAIGEAAGFGGGGIHGKRSLEGTFLGNCILNGRTAAKTIMG
ncbi:MAG TPA: FAD-binding dehydrogenase [Cyclobacteriaceae bacterium]|nr:FAD-binding dehydrogenase [Cyclobacteriaceae bacterium]